MAESGTIRVGTSGWHYTAWKGPFYPHDLRPNDFLAHYAREFSTVEINNSFYRLPSERAFASWRDTVPDGFLFSVKASRFITHMKKLKEPEKTLSPLLERAAVLGAKLGPILFQLPPRWKYNGERFRRFLDRLPGGYRYAFEFRDRTWWIPAVLEALTERNLAFCIHHIAGTLSPLEVTADFVYLRLHGPEGAYQGSYSEEALRGWAKRLRGWAGEGREVFCYFDNDEAGYAALNAAGLKELVKEV